ncbi:hypothetical protein [Marinicella sp. W31]|uniref:hypothetical protein n=1 Tax=Marinicella sp. W31 TaxID=3023713 RepID=UPI0037579EF7
MSIAEQKIIPEDITPFGFFGWSVSIDGDKALVGKRYDTENGYQSGAAYFFEFDGNGWIQTQKIISQNGQESDQFGYSVSLDGNKALIGSTSCSQGPGCGYIFQYINGAWVEIQKLSPSDVLKGENAATEVILIGDRAFINSIGDDDNGELSGAVYVFEYLGVNWIQTQKLTPSDGDIRDRFGYSMAVNDNTLAIGSPFDDDNGSASGSVYIWNYDGENWVQGQKLVYPFQQKPESTALFGSSVRMHENRLLIGAPIDEETGISDGAAYIFEFNGFEWIEVQKLFSHQPSSTINFGRSLDLSNDRILVNAYYYRNNKNIGAVFEFYYRNGSFKNARTILVSDPSPSGLFGNVISISGDRGIFGAPLDDVEINDSGSAHIYELEKIFASTFEQ